jgi:hypothetical protein
MKSKQTRNYNSEVVDFQGKRSDQVESSESIGCLCCIGFALVIFGILIFNTFFK